MHSARISVDQSLLLTVRKLQLRHEGSGKYRLFTVKVPASRANVSKCFKLHVMKPNQQWFETDLRHDENFERRLVQQFFRNQEGMTSSHLQTSACRTISRQATGWIGRGGPIAWPACSPDLTPLDYLLWSHMKGHIYETPVNSEEDLLAQIIAAADLKLPGIGDRVYQNMVRRYRVCVEVAGRHIEPFLETAVTQNSLQLARRTECLNSQNTPAPPTGVGFFSGGRVPVSPEYSCTLATLVGFFSGGRRRACDASQSHQNILAPSPHLSASSVEGGGPVTPASTTRIFVRPRHTCRPLQWREEKGRDAIQEPSGATASPLLSIIHGLPRRRGETSVDVPILPSAPPLLSPTPLNRRLSVASCARKEAPFTESAVERADRYPARFGHPWSAARSSRLPRTAPRIAAQPVDYYESANAYKLRELQGRVGIQPLSICNGDGNKNTGKSPLVHSTGIQPATSRICARHVTAVGRLAAGWSAAPRSANELSLRTHYLPARSGESLAMATRGCGMLAAGCAFLKSTFGHGADNDEALEVRASVARIVPSLLDFGRGEAMRQLMTLAWVAINCSPAPLQVRKISSARRPSCP
ncbi:hypothetical protein PR048_032160 [Dryococelus australis]|uniref:Uncharacterized protein n=1 Tax=Dryococelus australis TaxID=614101 RepID=A0ABQ9G1F2_9NEOP|nr:hypothetical protein PR048_032160 [Dryococelus australis]